MVIGDEILEIEINRYGTLVYGKVLSKTEDSIKHEVPSNKLIKSITSDIGYGLIGCDEFIVENVDKVFYKNYVNEEYAIQFVEDVIRLINEVNKPSFAKEDLELGMVLETRNRTRYILIELLGNRLILGLKKGFLDIDNFNKKLENRASSEYDIVKIYKPKNNADIRMLERNEDDFSRMVIWERK